MDRSEFVGRDIGTTILPNADFKFFITAALEIRAKRRLLEKNISRYRIRRFVKPGITGWAAINGLRGGTDDMDLMRKFLQ